MTDPHDDALAKALKTLELYEDALTEAEAIFGGEYANNYGPMFDLAMKARDARAVIAALPTSTVFEWTEVETVDEMQSFFRSRLAAIREAAKEHGYAIAVHGSGRRDFDLVAVPWVENYSSRDVLARAINKAACGLEEVEYRWNEKPNGRVAVSIPICWPGDGMPHDQLSLGCIDLSVTPPTSSPTPYVRPADAAQAAVDRLASYKTPPDIDALARDLVAAGESEYAYVRPAAEIRAEIERVRASNNPDRSWVHFRIAALEWTLTPPTQEPR